MRLSGIFFSAGASGARRYSVLRIRLLGSGTNSSSPSRASSIARGAPRLVISRSSVLVVATSTTPRRSGAREDQFLRVIRMRHGTVSTASSSTAVFPFAFPSAFFAALLSIFVSTDSNCRDCPCRGRPASSPLTPIVRSTFTWPISVSAAARLSGARVCFTPAVTAFTARGGCGYQW